MPFLPLGHDLDVAEWFSPTQSHRNTRWPAVMLDPSLLRKPLYLPYDGCSSERVHIVL